MKNNRGFAPILIVVVAALLLVVAVVVMMALQGGNVSDLYQTSTEVPSLSPAPVSDSTDVKTIESELDATTTGDVEEDIDSMESEASPLY